MSDGHAGTERVARSGPASLLAGPVAEAVCPFLGGLDELESGDVVGSPGEGNRCTAYWPWQPLGHLQQELVCLTAAHESCPRYRRGMRFGPAGPPRRRRLPFGIRAIFVALAGALAVGGLLLGGTFALGPLAAFIAGAPTVSPSASSIASVSPPAPTTAPTTQPTPGPTASPSPLPSETPLPTASPVALPTPPPGSPYSTLAPCPNGEYCYLYTVRSGDTLYAIASRFGTTVAAIRELNPEIGTGSLIVPGQKLKLPPP